MDEMQELKVVLDDFARKKGSMDKDEQKQKIETIIKIIFQGYPSIFEMVIPYMQRADEDEFDFQYDVEGALRFCIKGWKGDGQYTIDKHFEQYLFYYYKNEKSRIYSLRKKTIPIADHIYKRRQYGEVEESLHFKIELVRQVEAVGWKLRLSYGDSGVTTIFNKVNMRPFEMLEEKFTSPSGIVLLSGSGTTREAPFVKDSGVSIARYYEIRGLGQKDTKETFEEEGFQKEDLKNFKPIKIYSKKPKDPPA